MDEDTGQIFQVKELDLESISADRFSLEINAVQKDNPLKTAEAKVSRTLARPESFVMNE
jgi:hypothetical protein